MRPLLAGVVAVGLWGACVVAPPPPPPLPARAVAVAFDEALDPHGRWVVIAKLGRAWRPHPHVVGVDFVPYFSGGRWVHTQHGWVFDSEWPFGWAVFHYGRWYFDPLEGWVWVPADVWGPAWVEWRSGSGFVGWVPLPPPGIELVVPVYRPRWCFVHVHHFTHHEVWMHRVDEELVYHSAAPVPRVTAPDPAWVARESGTPVRTVNIGPRPPPGRVVAMPRIEKPPAVAVPPAELERNLRPEPPAPPPVQRFERPADRRPEPLPAPPAPATRKFERPPDRRPEPTHPLRFEAPPPRRQQTPAPPPSPAPAPAPAPPRRLDKKPPLAT